VGVGYGGCVVCEVEGVGGGGGLGVEGDGAFGIMLVAFFEGVGGCGEGAVGNYGLEGCWRGAIEVGKAGAWWGCGGGDVEGTVEAWERVGEGGESHYRLRLGATVLSED